MINPRILSKSALFGVLLLASTSLSFAAQAAPASALPAPDQSALQAPASAAPSPAASLLDDQSALQSGALPAKATDTPTASTVIDDIKSGTKSAVDAVKKKIPTASDAQPKVTTDANSKTSAAPADDMPAANAILEQMGAQNSPQQTAAATQEVQPIQAPPGLDLPVDQDLENVATEAKKKAEMRNKAFDASSQALMPMKTEEIRKLLEMYDETQQAVQTPIYPNPKPESTFQTISLEPGAAPVEIKTAVGHVTTLSIVDASGQPWPVQDISWAGNFEVLQPETGSNMLRITPMADFAYGNVSMRLVGLNPPVIITLRTERKSVQVRADIQIPELGPNGVAPPIQQQVTTTAGDAKLATILEGVAPSSSTRLNVAGIDGRTTAYEAGGLAYVRTPYTLLSPAWDSSVRSADGMNVYAMKFTPVLLLSDKGKMVRAQLSRVETSDE